MHFILFILCVTGVSIKNCEAAINYSSIWRAAVLQFSGVKQTDEIATEINSIDQFIESETNDIRNFAETLKPNPYNKTNSLIFHCANPTTKTFSTTNINDLNIATVLDLLKDLVFVIPGWKSHIVTSTMNDLAVTWIQYYDSNVCILDWMAYSFDDYISAVAENMFIAGDHVTNFIQFVKAQGGVDWPRITCAGHSLGAHVCGYIGCSSAGQLAKIYGLDPAGPLFTFPILVKPKYRLDPTDANLVTVIHTGAPLQGTLTPLGDIDIYPNKGKNIQPGCVDSIDGPAACSHLTSISIMINAITPGSICNAIKCDNEYSYKHYSCGGTITLNLDIASDDKSFSGRYYMVTDAGGICNGKFYN